MDKIRCDICCSVAEYVIYSHESDYDRRVCKRHMNEIKTSQQLKGYLPIIKSDFDVKP